jgi:hypothetical protein
MVGKLQLSPNEVVLSFKLTHFCLFSKLIFYKEVNFLTVLETELRASCLLDQPFTTGATHLGTLSLLFVCLFFATDNLWIGSGDLPGANKVAKTGKLLFIFPYSCNPKCVLPHLAMKVKLKEYWWHNWLSLKDTWLNTLSWEWVFNVSKNFELCRVRFCVLRTSHSIHWYTKTLDWDCTIVVQGS